MSADQPMHVVVAGAGVAGLEAALALRELAGDLVAVELVAPESEFRYRPLSVAEPYGYGEMRRFPLDRLVEAAGATLRTGSVSGLDADANEVTLTDGTTIGYDTLLVATGVGTREAVPGAVTFGGAGEREAIGALLDRAKAGEVKRIVFTRPPTPLWPLPLYELAFQTAERLTDELARGIQIVVATPEPAPLELFGRAASDEIARLLEIRSIEFRPHVVPLRWEDGVLHLAPGGSLDADAVVSLPRLVGEPIEGLPQDDESGFVATDELGWVLGLSDVYAAGDITDFPVKQGGIAAEQADTVATAIAADAGAPVRPRTFEPVLRGLLLTGMHPRYLRSEHEGRSSVVDSQPLWWPPAKIVGRHLTPFLAQQLGLAVDVQPPPGHALPVEVAIDTSDHARWARV
ncbi:MAG TPA: FAD-dependent oxidoreductase [Gaiellaceae bacterium]|nr:FAD-dependent oxidoreductase [Gaiellaceae bacterium]